jgi:hypothetical protein
VYGKQRAPRISSVASSHGKREQMPELKDAAKNCFTTVQLQPKLFSFDACFMSLGEVRASPRKATVS